MLFYFILKSARNDTNMELNTTRSKVSHTCLVKPPKSQISMHLICFAQEPGYRSLWDKCMGHIAITRGRINIQDKKQIGFFARSVCFVFPWGKIEKSDDKHGNSFGGFSLGALYYTSALQLVLVYFTRNVQLIQIVAGLISIMLGIFCNSATRKNIPHIWRNYKTSQAENLISISI